MKFAGINGRFDDGRVEWRFVGRAARRGIVRRAFQVKRDLALGIGPQCGIEQAIRGYTYGRDFGQGEVTVQFETKEWINKVFAGDVRRARILRSDAMFPGKSVRAFHGASMTANYDWKISDENNLRAFTK